MEYATIETLSGGYGSIVVPRSWRKMAPQKDVRACEDGGAVNRAIIITRPECGRSFDTSGGV